MDYSSIQSLFYQLTKTNSTSVPAATLNLYTQEAERHVCSLILSSDGRWQYDDDNQTDLPIGTTNLVSGQQDYSLSTAQKRIEGVAVLSAANVWYRLQPFDPDDIKKHFGEFVDRAQFMATPGRPILYDVKGSSVFLYPAPDNGVSVTLTSGLKIYYQRGPLVFDYSTGKFTDGTGSTASVPGFDSLFHKLIPLWAAYDFCVTNLPSLAAGYMNEIQRLEASLQSFYEHRDKDERQNITAAPIRFW